MTSSQGSSASFTLSAFGDEIADDLAEQLRQLRQLEVGYLELRGVWGKNVLHLDDEEVAQVRRLCDQYQMGVSAIGSPIGKSPLADPAHNELDNLDRICQIADALNTRRIRVFSFYPPDLNDDGGYDQYLSDVTARLTLMAEQALVKGVELLLENEKGIVGDTPERCHAILASVNSPHLRFAWDPANFVQVGVSRPTDEAWPLLGEFVAHVHVKDAASDGSVQVAGQGDGQVGELLVALRDRGYQGFLTLEPHLVMAGHSSGFSGASGMAHAVQALRALMARQGCSENRPAWSEFSPGGGEP
jgi:sugar phosphate isomerase/epimerase